MNTKLILGAVVVVVVVIAAVLLWPKPSVAPGPQGTASVSATPVIAPDAKNGTYTVDGESVIMRDGNVTLQLGAGVFVKYAYFQQSDGLLNEDQALDAGVIFTGDGGGSGTFYFVAALVSTGSGWKGTNAILLGDRIAPQTTDIENNTLIVNYADRKPGEPMTAKPSVGVTRYFQVRNGVLVEVKR